MAFSINGWTPPASARPSAPASQGVIRPESTAFDGEGRPVGAVGPVMAIVGRSAISAAGWGLWMDLFGATPTALSVAITSLTVYDPLLETEVTFTSGYILRPVWNKERSNPGVWYRDFRVTMMDLA